MDSLEGIDSRFRHAILAAKRAKQLVGGARKKVDISAENPLTIALEEIRQGKINFHILEEEAAWEFPREEVEVTEEDKEDKEEKAIDRDLFFRPNTSSNFEEDDEEDEDEDADEDEDEEDDDDEDGDDYGDDYDDDDDDEEGIIYDGDEEDD